MILDLADANPATLAGALGIPRYEAGLLARRGGLHLFRVLDAAAAEVEADRLGSLGVTALVVPEEAARVRPLRALGGRRTDEGLTLRTDEEGPLELRACDLLLVVNGPIVRERQTSFERRKVDSTRPDEGRRVHLHRASSPRPVEIDPDNFETGFSASGSARLEIDAWIAALDPHVPRDDGFRRLPPALAPAEPEPAGPIAALLAERRTPRRARRNGDGPRRARPPRQRRSVPLLLGLAGGRRATARARPAAPAMSSRRLRAAIVLTVLAAAPLAALVPALRAGRLLAPGEGAALHLPMRVEVFRAWSRGELPTWNASVFSGTPLLAAYRPGALHPLMAALAPLPPLDAFQALVLVSLALTGPLVFLLARRLGAGHAGAALAALGFALGPYLVAQLGDTATLVAAPALLVTLLALEAHLAGARRATAAALALAVLLVALAGSPEAALAAAVLLAARLAVALAAPWLVGRPFEPARATAVVSALAAAGVGVLLAAPQLLPTLVALAEAGPGTSGAARGEGGPLGGVAGLVVHSISHSPAAIFALAAVPLVPRAPRPRALVLVVAALLAALAARGLLEPPGGLALAFDLALAVAGGWSFSVQWRARHEPRGRRLRLLATVAALAASAGLSVATTVTGPLPQRLAAPVGLLALGLILYFVLAEARRPVAARVFLLPLLASFLLQPWGREAWKDAPTRALLEQGSPTREALDRAMGGRAGERTLSVALSWPSRPAAADLAWANAAVFTGRRNVNGYDPLVPLSRRRVLDGMRADGTLPASLLDTDPGRLGLLGVGWLQVPTDALVVAPDAFGVGDELDVVLDPPRPHLFALPITRATEVLLVSYLASSTNVEQGEIVAECVARLASGREVWLPIRAGVDTAEWAWDRPDVRVAVRHRQAEVHASFATREGFLGHQYRATLRLPGGPFAVTALRFRAWPDAPPLWLVRLGLRDAVSGRATGVSVASAYASDEARLAAAAVTPRVTLFEVRGGIAPAAVVESLRLLPDEAHVLDLLRAPTRLGVDTSREALATTEDGAGIILPAGSRSSPADLARAAGGRMVLRAAGPGLLVVGEGYDAGWRARVDGASARVVRVNGDRIGVVLGGGNHRDRARALRPRVHRGPLRRPPRPRPPRRGAVAVARLTLREGAC